MLKRIASDVTEPASPDALLHHNVHIELDIQFFRRIEAIREEYRRRMEEIGLLNGPPATVVNDIVDTGLDDPIYEQWASCEGRNKILGIFVWGDRKQMHMH